jgi:hypothetical protein
MTSVVIEDVSVIASFPVRNQTITTSHRNNRTRPDDNVWFFLAGRTAPITSDGISIIAPLAALLTVLTANRFRTSRTGNSAVVAGLNLTTDTTGSYSFAGFTASKSDNPVTTNRLAITTGRANKPGFDIGTVCRTAVSPDLIAIITSFKPLDLTVTANRSNATSRPGADTEVTRLNLTEVTG